MQYIIIDKDVKRAFKVTDVTGVSELIKRNKHTIHSWFRKGKTYHNDSKYDVFKGFNEIKSKRKNLNNLKPFQSA
jgi:mevalonate pyrophosphate decarboxylase